jgi:hypothetical protein
MRAFPRLNIVACVHQHRVFASAICAIGTTINLLFHTAPC